jgi:prepilin-type N-terminal cleavage/methylation domain-containing protein
MNNKGYSLVEMLVAIAIFSVLLVAVMNTFTRGFAYQKRIVEMQKVQREEAFLLETVSREVRMATAIADSQKNLHDAYRLDFSDHTGTLVTYCLALENGTCSAAGKYFSIGGAVVNSTDVEVSGVKFSTSETFDKTQPLITITMQIRSKKEPAVSTVLQTSVATRLYK